MPETCPNCYKPVPSGAEHCPVCSADLNAPAPAPPRTYAPPPRALLAIVASSVGIALEIWGAATGNVVAVAIGYFGCSISFRLARAELAALEPGLAPGPAPSEAARSFATTGRWIALAGMLAGIPLGLTAVFAPWVPPS